MKLISFYKTIARQPLGNSSDHIISLSDDFYSLNYYFFYRNKESWIEAHFTTKFNKIRGSQLVGLEQSTTAPFEDGQFWATSNIWQSSKKTHSAVVVSCIYHQITFQKDLVKIALELVCMEKKLYLSHSRSFFSYRLFF